MMMPVYVGETESKDRDCDVNAGRERNGVCAFIGFHSFANVRKD